MDSLGALSVNAQASNTPVPLRSELLSVPFTEEQTTAQGTNQLFLSHPAGQRLEPKSAAEL